LAAWLRSLTVSREIGVVLKASGLLIWIVASTFRVGVVPSETPEGASRQAKRTKESRIVIGKESFFMGFGWI
jgi:hypothetical protein